jgi:hypothetical protein
MDADTLVRTHLSREGGAPMGACGESGTIVVHQCGREGTRGWLRWASAEEIDAFHESGDLPPYLTEATVSVVSCDDHAVTAGFAEPHMIDGEQYGYNGTDVAVLTHDAGCRQPAERGECAPCASYFDPHPEPLEEG